ncbi:hypothetical protein SHIRM173S_01174 [Streptomyces hirsutus]
MGVAPARRPLALPGAQGGPHDGPVPRLRPRPRAHRHLAAHQSHHRPPRRPRRPRSRPRRRPRPAHAPCPRRHRHPGRAASLHPHHTAENAPGGGRHPLSPSANVTAPFHATALPSRGEPAGERSPSTRCRHYRHLQRPHPCRRSRNQPRRLHSGAHHPRHLHQRRHRSRHPPDGSHPSDQRSKPRNRRNSRQQPRHGAPCAHLSKFAIATTVVMEKTKDLPAPPSGHEYGRPSFPPIPACPGWVSSPPWSRFKRRRPRVRQRAPARRGRCTSAA